MAIAYNVVSKDGLSKRTVVDITLDGSYPGSGGYALSASGLGMLSLPDSMNCGVKTGQGVLPVYNQGSGKLQMLKGAAGLLVECAAGDLSTAVVVRATCHGNPVM